ncbi:MAG: rod shape-determining protein [Anaerovoracaceae bacterium]|jgi:rod shape-determining protein MreB
MCFKMFSQDVGIDLGTANTLIYIKGKGIILKEPSVIAVDTNQGSVYAVGLQAADMLGRVPENIKVVRPIKGGVISDYTMTQEMLREFLVKAFKGGKLIKKNMRVVVGVPSGISNVERRAIEEVIRQMGAKQVFILDEPMAAAIGSGIPVDEARGHMIADIGGGTSDVAIISLGGIVNSTALRHAGDDMDEAIVGYMRKTFGLLIGEKTAEQIKIKIGCVYNQPNEEGVEEEILAMEAKGRDVVSGLPRTVTVTSMDVVSALGESVSLIIEAVKTTLENAPPELAADIMVNGMVLTGGCSHLRGFAELIAHHTGLNVTVAENALEAVAEGTGNSLSHIDKLKRYVKGSNY